MDDRDLEARLRTRLHTRFDESPIPPALASNVQRVLTTTPARVGFSVRPGNRWLGWSAVAAAAVLVAATVAIGNMPGPAATSSASPGSTPMTTSLQPPQGSWRYFAVLPPTGATGDLDSAWASDILHARVKALGGGNSMLETGNGIFIGVAPGGPSDEMIRAVLGAYGDVEFVPLPAADYADIPVPEAGQALPIDEPPLFGNEGLAAVGRDVVNDMPAVGFTLTPAAAKAFGDYTAKHMGEYFAIVMDGKIVSVAVINEPIPGGQFQVTSGMAPISGEPDTAFEIAAAVLIGGRLPPGWQGARVPAIVSLEFAKAAAQAQFPSATLEATNLTAEDDGDGWHAVWYIVFTGDVGGGAIPCPTPGPSGDSCPTAGPTRRVVIDAERGNVLRIEIPTD